MTEFDLNVEGGHRLHVYDTGARQAADDLTVFWHHGTPNIGVPPQPLFSAASARSIRWIGYDRPGYARSTPTPQRRVASAASHVAAIADALGITQFAVMGHSGGGSHALACGALLPDRVLGVISIAALAPFDSDGLNWFAGMTESTTASLQAAISGRAAKLHHAMNAEYDPAMFTAADHAALAGAWSWFGDVVDRATQNGLDGLIDDDLAHVAPWGFHPADITVPVLILHGGQDRIVPCAHGRWLARHCPTAQLRWSADDGHISILNSASATLDWLRSRAR
jgi:pimeloyl-ACP methyl ester carboxylesterase